MSNAQQLIDVEKISQADLLKFESDYPHKCEATGCVLPAESGVCIEFYPLPAYMAFHRSNAPITYMLVGLRVCHKHLYEFDAKDFFTNEDGSGEKMIRLVENSSGVTVDRHGFKVTAIALDHPDYVKLLKNKDSEK